MRSNSQYGVRQGIECGYNNPIFKQSFPSTDETLSTAEPVERWPKAAVNDVS